MRQWVWGTSLILSACNDCFSFTRGEISGMTQQWRSMQLINTERAADATVMVRETRGQLKGENVRAKSPKEAGYFWGRMMRNLGNNHKVEMTLSDISSPYILCFLSPHLSTWKTVKNRAKTTSSLWTFHHPLSTKALQEVAFGIGYVGI